LGVEGIPSPEIWLLDHKLTQTIDGGFCSSPPVIGLAKGIHENGYALLHELAHHYLTGWPARLPVLVEEGVADLVAGWEGNCLEAIRELRGAHLEDGPDEDVAGDLSLSRKEFREIADVPRTRQLRGVGFVIAERAGLDTIRALCRMAADQGRDTVPSEWFLPFWIDARGS
jgi:hypothetical protein